VRDFHDLDSPGRLTFSVADARNGAALDARIVITTRGAGRVSRRQDFFHATRAQGHADLPIAPGRYLFTVSAGRRLPGAGRGRCGYGCRRSGHTTPGRHHAAVRSALARLVLPDLHHHADQAEAVTPPADLARSQLAADSICCSSAITIDSTSQCCSRLPAWRVLHPGTSCLRPGPLQCVSVAAGARLAIDTGRHIDMILKEARRNGATVCSQSPIQSHVYFASLKTAWTRGFNPGFDLMEINSSVPMTTEGAGQAVEFWIGQRYYISAGSGHPLCWNDQSGRVRTFAHLDGQVTPQAFAQALKAGHAYVSYGRSSSVGDVRHRDQVER